MLGLGKRASLAMHQKPPVAPLDLSFSTLIPILLCLMNLSIFGGCVRGISLPLSISLTDVVLD